MSLLFLSNEDFPKKILPFFVWNTRTAKTRSQTLQRKNIDGMTYDNFKLLVLMFRRSTRTLKLIMIEKIKNSG